MMADAPALKIVRIDVSCIGNEFDDVLLLQYNNIPVFVAQCTTVRRTGVLSHRNFSKGGKINVSDVGRKNLKYFLSVYLVPRFLLY
jgi:hypothetical protein